LGRPLCGEQGRAGEHSRDAALGSAAASARDHRGAGCGGYALFRSSARRRTEHRGNGGGQHFSRACRGTDRLRAEPAHEARAEPHHGTPAHPGVLAVDRTSPAAGDCHREHDMSKTILITGGAGFIGSHLADELLRHGYRVRALDNLCTQVHGEQRQRPDYLAPEVELIEGDVRDPATVQRAIQGVDGVFHYAAAVGVGQSMYQIAAYTAINNLGTAVLMEAL